MDLRRLPPEQRPAWAGALVLAPALRAGYLALGWLRFRRAAS